MDNMTIFDMLYPTFKISKPIRLIELFAGVGSQAMALRDLGTMFEHHRVVEIDKYAVASYNAIHDTNFTTTDIRDFKGEDLGIVDTNNFTYIMTYSFPCQDLSVAGKMQGMAKGSNTRSGLLWEVERLLGEVEELPQVLLMENVPQVISDANISDFHKWQDFLTDKGYTNYVEVLNAKDFGVAQNRERAFMVSVLGKWNYKFPQPIPLTKAMADYLEDEVDEKYYINSDKANKLIQQLMESGQLDGVKTCVDGTINEPKQIDTMNCIKARYDAGISNFRSEGGMVVEPIIIGGMQKNQSIKTDGICTTLTSSMGTGGGYVPMVTEPTVKIKQATQQGYVECKLGGVADLSYPTSKTRRGRVQDGGDTCPTLTATETGVCRIETPYRIRKLTPKECWRLMDFTDEDFYKAESVNSNTQLYKQAGNSIVKAVLMAIFKQIL